MLRGGRAAVQRRGGGCAPLGLPQPRAHLQEVLLAERRQGRGQGSPVAVRRHAQHPDDDSAVAAAAVAAAASSSSTFLLVPRFFPSLPLPFLPFLPFLPLLVVPLLVVLLVLGEASLSSERAQTASWFQTLPALSSFSACQ